MKKHTFMGSLPRRRTRSQWDEYYKNVHNELKAKNKESGCIVTSEGNKVVISNGVVDSESNNGGKCKERQDFVVNIGGKRGGGKETVEQDESSGGRDVKRTRNVFADDPSRSRENVASCGVERGKGKKELDVEAKSDGGGVLGSDDGVEFVGEEVVSNGSSLKTGQESRSGSGSKVGNLDEVVSGDIKKVEESRVDADVVDDAGMSPIERLDEEHLPLDDVFVDLENFTKLGDSTNKSSDVSDNSVESSEEPDSSTEEDDFSDEDYNVDEMSTSAGDDDSDVSYSRNSAKRGKKDDEYDSDCSDSLVKGEEDKKRLETPIMGKRMNEKESDDKQEEDDASNEGYNGDNDDGSSSMKRRTNQEKDEDDLLINEDKEKVPSIRKRTRSSWRDETEREDHEIADGYEGTADCRDHGKIRAKKKKEDDMVIIDDPKFASVRNNARVERKRDGEFAGLSKIHQTSPNYGRGDAARNDGDTGTLKKRKVLGLEILIDSDKATYKNDTSIANRLRSRNFFTSHVPLAKSVEPAPDMDDDPSSREEEKCNGEQVLKMGEKWSEKEAVKTKKTQSTRNHDLIKILVDSINFLKGEKSAIEDNHLKQEERLPFKFRFEDEDEPPPEKSEWEKEMDSLFRDLELGLRESESDYYDQSCVHYIFKTEKAETEATKIDTSPAACCSRGEHEPILNEQIGVVCKYCLVVILDIKYVLPPFYVPPPRRQDWREYDESPSPVINQMHFQDTACKTPDSSTHVTGTVWDLIPGVEKEMYPHQREGFEFIWKNIAEDISIEKLKRPLPEGGRGCIISHAPGTGKTRLTIVFLTTFMKLYPNCRPVIIAPKGMLLTWEAEFIKWRAHTPFHILNKKELSGREYAIAASVLGQSGVGFGMDAEYIRLVRLLSWMKGGSVLGISYHLFKNLAGRNGKKGQNEHIKKLLLESPGLLVLDEGHTPRNDQSQLWRALAKVVTPHRIILSGTPFQNNMKELFNTLCLVNPKFVNQIGSQNTKGFCYDTRGRKSSMARKKWTIMTSSIGKNRDSGLKKLKAMLDPFVHVHKGTILEEHLFGLRDTLVFLHPTELQKTLLETASRATNIFHRIRLVSLVSVHPSLMPDDIRLPVQKSKLEEIESDVDAGVKTKFLMKLIRLAGALNERVLIFSQYLDPLHYIKKQIMSRFSWNEGKEVLYMDGNLDEKQRQDSISSLNDDSSEAKVLLASLRACSEGISLVGASRVVLLDTVWNPSVEKQAISRAYRLGQKRVVYVYRLFTSGTEVSQYAQQFKKEQISELIFSPADGNKCEGDKSSRVVSEDKVLEAMVSLEGYNECFEKIIHQPKESDLIEIFGRGQ